MNITGDVHKYAAEQDLSEEEALKRGMEDKSREFVEKGSEIYANEYHRRPVEHAVARPY